MSVRVNLLPEATKQRGRANQQRLVAAAAGLLLLLALGGVWLMGQMRISNAEDELASEQVRTAELRAEEAELVAFAALSGRRDAADAILATAMAEEVSLAAILQDLAAVIPTDTQFDTVGVQMTPPGDGNPAGTVGTLSISAKTLTAHAPGVERTLIGLDKISTFRDLYLNASSLDADDDRVASFSVDGSVSDSARTGRYLDGLPEELR